MLRILYLKKDKKFIQWFVFKQILTFYFIFVISEYFENLFIFGK
jgi:hypothetical protein